MFVSTNKKMKNKKNRRDQVATGHDLPHLVPATAGELHNHFELSQLLTRAEVAAILRVSLPTLDKRVTEGLLRSTRIGRKRLFQRDAVINFIREQMDTGTHDSQSLRNSAATFGFGKVRLNEKKFDV
jgi:excisionase family DNA binding protein